MTVTQTLITNDGIPVDIIKNDRGFFDIHIAGTLASHAMIYGTALLVAEEAVKCWNEEAGLYTYEGENPYPQYIPQMLETFPQYHAEIKATARKRRRRITA